jgi:hypothetical protein
MDKARLELLDGALQALLEALQPSADFEDERRKVVTDMQQLVQQVRSDGEGAHPDSPACPSSAQQSIWLCSHPSVSLMLLLQALPPEFHASVETFGSYRAGLHLPGMYAGWLAGWLAEHMWPVLGTPVLKGSCPRAPC